MQYILVSAADFIYKIVSDRKLVGLYALGGLLENRPAAPLAQQDSENNWWDYCPICSSRLNNQKCKYVCPNPQCHFFMSCSEFDR
ncbi:MAG: hypothetical protein ACXW6J_01490 [Candidatus Binatia bacterium]